MSRDVLSPKQLAEAQSKMLVIHRGQYRLHFYRRKSDQLRFRHVRSFPIAIGAIGYETPSGMFLIKRKALNPDWTAPYSEWVPEDLRGVTFDGYDPRNPIKAAFLDIWDGVGIHGTDDLASLGTQASHGCIRMTPADVRLLYRRIPVGTPVYIT
jgi:lipoprotein-anchoring transpeptidase ErfK/SrfK